MIDSSFADRDSACTMQLLVKAGGDSDSMARLTGFVSMLQQVFPSGQSLEEYQARVADRCEVGKNCCTLRILESQDDFKNEVSLLEIVVLKHADKARQPRHRVGVAACFD